MQVVRSIVVLIIAYYAIGTVVGIVDSGLHAVFPGSQPDLTTGRLPWPGWLVGHIVEVGIIAVASAYCAALMAGRAELLHVCILGAWMVLVGLGTYAVMGERWPVWFRAGLALVPVPAVLLGGFLRIRQRNARSRGSDADRRIHIVRRAVLWGIALAILLGAHYYQNNPYYRRHVSIRQVFWYFELPILVTAGAALGYSVGRWRRAKHPVKTAESSAQTGA